MRRTLITVPQQLHSVAARYQRAVGQSNVFRRPPGWRVPACQDEGIGGLPVTECERDERLRRIEAILFLAREPLSSRRLCQYANLADGTEARTLVRHLNVLLDGSGRAFRVEEVAGGFQLLTRPKFATWLRRLATVPKELRLSAPALETLSVIAYRQPAGRAEIEAVRGVNCGEIIHQLMDRDLVRIAGRSEELGRPYLYATTRRFLQLFGLRRLEDLPRAQQLRKGSPTQNLTIEPTDKTETRNIDSSDRNEEESDVTATIRAELSPDELRKRRLGGVPVVLPRASDDETVEDDGADADEEEDDDEFDDLEDDDDEEFDDDDDDEEFDDVDDDEGFEDEDWEEVDDEDEELDDEDEEDWDDDDEDDDEEEEEGESWE